MEKKKLSFTTGYVLAFGLLMLIANALLGAFILYQSNAEMVSLINKNMLDVVRSAAAIMNGDAMAALTEADVGDAEYEDIEEKLLAFQNHEDIVFIYAVRQESDGRFVFIVDPDPVEPAAFGEEIVVTEALISAGKGTAAVDAKTAADRWGNYYSAYCPVFDSSGNVGGIVGIDFDAAWYEAALRNQTVSTVIFTLMSVIVGVAVVFFITYNVRKRFAKLDTGLSKLSRSVDAMVKDAGVTVESQPAEPAAYVDEIDDMSEKILMVQKSMDAYEKLQKDRYYRDSLTGLLNLKYVRQFADDRLNKLWATYVTPAVMYFDLRSMVSYNTEYGYSRGDELLKLTAETLLRVFPYALVGRGEGGHFIVISEFDADIGNKIRLVNEIVKKNAYGRTNGIQCAIVKMMPGMKAVDGLQRALSTLKKFDNDLNVIFRIYSYEDDEDFLISQYIVQHFDEALQNKWIKVYYQPVIRANSRKISVIEALARWVDPVKGLISPGQFIPVLSQYHMLHKLDLYMAETICREFHVRKEAGLPQIPVTINFSAQDFDYIDVPEAINKIMEKYGLSREKLIIEITEQDMAQATDFFKNQLQRIHDDGYKLWIDDFGSGYSSLSVISLYPVDRIKIDMALIRHLNDNGGANRIIIKAVVDMCRQMGIHTLAEGIENEEQYEFLCSIDCEMVQGFMFYKPEPVETAIEGFKNRTADIPHETTSERNELGAIWLKKGKDPE